MLDAADKSRSDGHVQRARDAYRAAAASYPSEHLPWVRLAQSHYEAADYGNAIVAAEEALQRNPHDQAALGVMAVAGLRVSSRAVSGLQSKQALGDSRSQAESIVQTLRSAFGETSLVTGASDTPPEIPLKTPTKSATHNPDRVTSKSPKQGQTAPTNPATTAAASNNAKRPLVATNPLDVLR